jgi:hypothetical protein
VPLFAAPDGSASSAPVRSTHFRCQSSTKSFRHHPPRLPEQMVAAYDDAYARGLGAVQFEGAMIDVPVVERARTVLKRAAAIRKRVGA